MTTTDPLFSRCSLGKGRWFWCVWTDFESLCDEKPLPVTGIASSAIEAEKTALTIAPNARQYSATFAAGYHRRLCARQKAAKAGNHGGTQPLEFVYQDWMSDYDNQEHSTPHLIVKKTPKKVFVERDSYNPGLQPYGDWRDYYYRQTYALDRAKLEQAGHASYGRHGWWQTFYTEPWEKRHHAWVPACLTLLGLPASASEDEIKRVYRRLAKQHHPDRGGDPEKFKEVQAAYEEALAFLSKDVLHRRK